MTELKVKCTSCGHLQRLFDYEKHTFNIPAKENEAFNNWLTEYDKQIREKVIDKCIEKLYEVTPQTVDEKLDMVFVNALRELKEQNK